MTTEIFEKIYELIIDIINSEFVTTILEFIKDLSVKYPIFTQIMMAFFVISFILNCRRACNVLAAKINAKRIKLKESCLKESRDFFESIKVEFKNIAKNIKQLEPDKTKETNINNNITITGNK